MSIQSPEAGPPRPAFSPPSSLPHATSADRWRVICAGIAALILSVGLARFAYTPLLPIMRDEANLSAFAGGWLATVNYGGYIMGALIAATISNLRHKFFLYRLGLVLAVLTTTAMGMTQDPILWGILRFVAGFSSTAGLLLASGLVLNWLIRHGFRPELGLHFAGIGLGIAVSGVAVVAMVGALSWDGQWLVLGAVGIAFFIPAWAWLPAPDPVRTQSLLTAPAMPGRAWMWLLITSYFCAGFGYVISATFIVAIVEKLPLLAGKGSWVWIIVGVAAIPSCFLWDRVAAWAGPVMALLLAYGLQIISIILPAVDDQPISALLSAVLYGGTFVGIVSLTLSLIGRYFPHNPAKAMAKLTLSYGVAQILAPAMAGYIATQTGSYRGSLVVAAWVMVVGMGLLLAMRWQEKRSAVIAQGKVLPGEA